jgi:hypothetical protein
MFFTEIYSHAIQEYKSNKEEILKSFLEKEGLLDNYTTIRELFCYDNLTLQENVEKANYEKLKKSVVQNKLNTESKTTIDPLTNGNSNSKLNN